MYQIRFFTYRDGRKYTTYYGPFDTIQQIFEFMGLEPDTRIVILPCGNGFARTVQKKGTDGEWFNWELASTEGR